jgi:hypothetical protein
MAGPHALSHPLAPVHALVSQAGPAHAQLWFTQRLAAELQNTHIARQRAVATRDELESALTGQVAAALDADFRQLDAGRARATDFASGRPAGFLFARIPGTGGTSYQCNLVMRPRN